MCRTARATHEASSSKRRWFMLYGTHSVPLRRHFAHLASPSTGSHLILCLLHSAPVVESVDVLRVCQYRTTAYRLGSWASAGDWDASHPRDRRPHLVASGTATYLSHQALITADVTDRQGLGIHRRYRWSRGQMPCDFQRKRHQ